MTRNSLTSRNILCVTGALIFASTLNATPEGPRKFVDTTFPVLNGRTIVVGGSDNLQTVLDTVQSGDTVLLPPGSSFRGNYVLRSNQGSQWIVIASASLLSGQLPPSGIRIQPQHSPLMAKILSPNGNPALSFEAGASRYRIVGLEITTDPAVTVNNNFVTVGMDQTSPSLLPSHVIFDRMFIHGYRTQEARRGIALNCASCAVIDSHISDFHQSYADSQAVCSWNGPGPYRIENNFFEAAGENVMFGGAAALGPDMNPADIQVRYNHFAKPPRWKRGHPDFREDQDWRIKNNFELKNASRAIIEQNVFENNWPKSQSGFAIVINPINDSGRWAAIEDVVFRDNVVRNTGSGLSIAGPWMENPASLARISFENNVLEGIESWPLMLLGCPQCAFEHNTVIQLPTSTLMTVFDGQPNEGLIFRNNVFSRYGLYGVAGSDTAKGLPSFERFAPPSETLAGRVSGNLFVNDRALSWMHPYPAGNHILSDVTEVGFTDLAGGHYNLRLDSSYAGRATDGRDPGADVTALTIGRYIATSGRNISRTPGDLNGDGDVNCIDLSVVKTALGQRIGSKLFDFRADVIMDGVIDVRDLARVAQQLPLGTLCKP